jgi:hypothetical protein
MHEATTDAFDVFSHFRLQFQKKNSLLNNEAIMKLVDYCNPLLGLKLMQMSTIQLFLKSLIFINVFIILSECLGTADGGTVVKVLPYKSEGRWFNSRWYHWNFSLT